MGKILRLFLIVAALMLSCNSAFAIVVTVDYSYSGSPGDYLLDFTVTNNIPASYQQAVYYFGVDLANDPFAGVPARWSDLQAVWCNTFYGGSDICYQNTWISYDAAAQNYSSNIVSGSSASGFTVHSSTIPSTIHYFAFAHGTGWYYGQDAFYYGTDYLTGNNYPNPAFEGIVGGGETAVPEPASMALLGLGLAGLVGLRRKKVL